MTEHPEKLSRKRRNWLLVLISVLLGAAVCGRAAATSETADSRKQTEQSGEAESELTEEETEKLKAIRSTYEAENQTEIAASLEQKKQEKEYNVDDILTVYNPYGTNTQSMYVYFTTEYDAQVTYTVRAADQSVGDFTRQAYQKETYQKEHEFQIMGLVPNVENIIELTITDESGGSVARTVSYEMGSLLGDEELQLETDADEACLEELSDGLYVVLGNDNTQLDFMYYYDNLGVLRGEVPLLGYRSHRLLFDENTMYYSISETKMAAVDRLGRVTQVYDLGDYSLHHDYVFDDDGNLLILASDRNQDRVEDVVVKLDVRTGEVTEVLDLGNILDDYKATCLSSDEGELDWMHINTIQWMGDGEILLSSRETSSILKISGIYESPDIDYMIGSEEFWQDTGYEDLLLEKDGEFTIQGGQHSVTYVEDNSLEQGQYYLYMFNNNIGYSTTQPDFDWSLTGLTETGAKEGSASYYYKYLVDENKGTFRLVDSFALPYSGYVSSVQEIDKNVVADSGFAGVFGEYDEDHQLIASYKMKMEKFLYRVYKYQF